MSITDNSWIKLPRSFAKWRWYHDSNMVHLYLYLLLNANLQDEEYNEIIIHRGEIITSLPQLSTNTSLSIKSIRTCITKLVKTKEIKCKQTHKGRIIILVDFNRFQPIGVDEYCIDWIKLYRQICTWRWFHKTKFFHIFLHLMIQAKIVTLDNGICTWQCTTSLSQLNQETGISVQSIRTCIKKLQETGEITYSIFSTNRKSIITICNYDTYQSPKIETGRQTAGKRQATGSQTTGNCVDLQNVSKSTQTNKGLKYTASSIYQSPKIETGRQTAGKRQANGRQTADKRQTNGRQTAPIKDYKNIRIKDNIIYDDCARTRESDFVEVSEVVEEREKENEQKKVGKESFADKVVQEQAWLAAIQQKYKLENIDTVKQKVSDFALELICRGKEEHQDEKDFKCHFCDWLCKNLSESPTKVNATGTQQPGKERWLGEKFVPKNSKGGVYDGPF